MVGCPVCSVQRDKSAVADAEAEVAAEADDVAAAVVDDVAAEAVAVDGVADDDKADTDA